MPDEARNREMPVRPVVHRPRGGRPQAAPPRLGRGEDEESEALPASLLAGESLGEEVVAEDLASARLSVR
jgi:hypothetical protein